MITYKEIRSNETIRTYVQSADASLAALGFTEHSFAHVTHVAEMAGNILSELGYDERTVEITKIAGFLHDIGNLVNRVDHSQSGAIIAFRILDKMGMEPQEMAKIVAAIGNHDEGTGVPVSPLAAALIIADKSDVRRSRVREKDLNVHDIHDRVNYSVTASKLLLNKATSEITLKLTIDTTYSSVMDYFEIFLSRMLMCKKAADTLGLQFRLNINGQLLL
ncbi:MAG: HD domain-containing protein [Clostridia bacterium]|nr:HD domain-containing protein [Clostridia bacterium]